MNILLSIPLRGAVPIVRALQRTALLTFFQDGSLNACDNEDALAMYVTAQSRFVIPLSPSPSTPDELPSELRNEFHGAIVALCAGRLAALP